MTPYISLVSATRQAPVLYLLDQLNAAADQPCFAQPNAMLLLWLEVRRLMGLPGKVHDRP